MKSKKLLYLYAFLMMIAIFLMVLLFNLNKNVQNKLQQARDYAVVMRSGELNVVTDYNSIGYYISGDSVMGFQYEMMRALEKAWGVKVNIFLENSLDENLNGLLAGKYDLVARSIPVNTELKDTFAFTQSIVLNKQILVQRKAVYNDSIEPLRQHLDLAKRTVYVSKDSPAMLRLKNLSHEIGDTIYIQQNNTYETEQLVMMVASGDIDFTVCDEKVAKQLGTRFPEIDIETDISFTQLESWAMRKDAPVLLDSLNAWLNHFRETKEFRKIYDRYY